MAHLGGSGWCRGGYEDPKSWAPTTLLLGADELETGRDRPESLRAKSVRGIHGAADSIHARFEPSSHGLEVQAPGVADHADDHFESAC